jgi:RimJ/RimL family protein N-acetyltransferase
MMDYHGIDERILNRKMSCVRPLQRREWELFRSIRLEALTLEPNKFGASKDIEEKHGSSHWRNWIKSKGRRVFGLFNGQSLVGITSIITWDKNILEIKSAFDWPQGRKEQTALCVGTYIKKEFRGRGLTQLLYLTRLDWACNQPQFRRVLTAHRASNDKVQQSHLLEGFVPIERRPYHWVDGTNEDLVIYAMDHPNWRWQFQDWKWNTFYAGRKCMP